MADRGSKIIITLVIILVGVVAIGVAALMLLPDTNTPVADDLPPDTTAPTSPGPTLDQSGFRLDILEQPAYQLLSKQLVQDGSLPVQPPPVTGKANPFL